MNWYRLKLAQGFPAGFWFTENGPIVVREYEGAGQHEQPVLEQICANHGVTLKDTQRITMEAGDNWVEEFKKLGFTEDEIDAFTERDVAIRIGIEDFGWVRQVGDSIQTRSVSNKDMLMIKDSLLQVYGNQAHKEYLIEIYPSGKVYQGIHLKDFEFIDSEKDLREKSSLKF